MKEFCTVLPLLFARLEQLRQVMEKHGIPTDMDPVSYSHRHWQWSLGRGHLELSLEVTLQEGDDPSTVEWALTPISDEIAGILVATWTPDGPHGDRWSMISTAGKREMRAQERSLLDQLQTRHILGAKRRSARLVPLADALVAFEETCALLATLPPEPDEDTDEADAA